MELKDVRNIREAVLELGPGLNVLVGRNAQGKTSVLEGAGLLARGRSFRTEETRLAIRRGAPALVARGRAREEAAASELEVEVTAGGRRLRADGREVAPRAYQGRLEVSVYSTDRLRVVRGPMRERRAHLDRSASVIWPAYRQALRDYERVVAQRNAALETGGPGLEAWDERLVTVGAELRVRRSAYVDRLRSALRQGFAPEGERFDLELRPRVEGAAETERTRLCQELRARERDERRLRRTLVGPHRDEVRMLLDGEEAGESASSGQARSLLLAVTLAGLEVYRQEIGRAAVALLDDLDSELDESRATALCREVAARGQALVTTAHPGWAGRLGGLGRIFEVEQGRVRAA